MTDDIDWRPVIGAAKHVPYSGAGKGKPGVAELFKQAAKMFTLRAGKVAMFQEFIDVPL